MRPYILINWGKWINRANTKSDFIVIGVSIVLKLLILKVVIAKNILI